MAVKTWSNGAGGNWNVGGNWIGGVPGNTDDALIQSPPTGTYTVTISDNESAVNVTLNDPTATLSIASGGALFPAQLNLNAGTFSLAGSLTGATVVNNGGTATTFNANNGTLNGDVWQGALTLTSGGISITNGITVTDVAGTGAGTISLGSASLSFTNSTAFDGVSPTQRLTTNFASSVISIAASSTLILGPNAAIIGTGTTSNSLNFSGQGTVDNQGTISSNGVNGGNFNVAAPFTNEATSSISFAGSFFSPQIFRGTFSNLGTVTVGNVNLYYYGGLVNSGVINAANFGGAVAKFTNTGIVNISGVGTVSAGETFGLPSFDTGVNNSGTINLGLSAGLAFAEGITSSGRFNLANFATLDVQTVSGGTIDLQATRGVLRLENAGTLGATVFGFRKATVGNAADQIDIVNGGTFVSATFSGTSAGGALTIVTNNGTTNLTNVVNLTGADYTAAAFNHASDGGTGTYITTNNTACFLAGTRILTDRGEVAVEDLQAGDVAVTAYGPTRAQQPIRWIGHTRIDLDRHPTPQTVGPIRVAAGAFGANMPHADLLLSPDHSVFVAGGGDAPGFLVPVHYLVNGGSIRREAVGGIVTYYHVELDQHDVLLANGLPAESYLDTGNRADFANGGGVQTLFPEFRERAWSALACAEMVTDGARLDATRAMLAEQAARLGLARTADPQVAVEANGRAVAVSRTAAGWSCIVPAGSDTVRVASLSFIPDELDRAAGDARRLGLCLRAVRLGGHDLALDGAAMASGFHAVEAGWRWTDGDATLRFAPLAEDTVFEIDAIDTGVRYWTTSSAPKTAAAARRAA